MWSYFVYLCIGFSKNCLAPAEAHRVRCLLPVPLMTLPELRRALGNDKSPTQPTTNRSVKPPFFWVMAAMDLPWIYWGNQ